MANNEPVINQENLESQNPIQDNENTVSEQNVSEAQAETNDTKPIETPEVDSNEATPAESEKSETPADAEPVSDTPESNTEPVQTEVPAETVTEEAAETKPNEAEPVQAEAPAETAAEKIEEVESKEPNPKDEELAKQQEAEKKAAREAEKKRVDGIYNELKEIKEAGNNIEVFVKSTTKGGLRVTYKDMPMFLPASHITLKRAVSKDLIEDQIGKNLEVSIHDLEEDSGGRKTVVVSRKSLLENDFWKTINIGDVVEAPVSSVAKFGLFLDLGGYEGLIHVSRLSNNRVTNPADIAKKGDIMKAKVIEIDKDKKRIALSSQEFEASPWDDLKDEFKVGSRVKGIVKRVADYGAFVEVKEGIDGLLRTSELSWTRRVKNAREILNPGDELELEVLNFNLEKKMIGLSLKNTMPNPWDNISAKYNIGNELKGIVKQTVPQGCVVNINDEIDAFMPKSKMRGMMQNDKIPFKVGDEIDVVIADLVPANASMILAPQGAEEQRQAAPKHSGPRPERRQSNRGDSNKKFNDPAMTESVSGSFSLGDLLNDKLKEKLMDKLSD